MSLNWPPWQDSGLAVPPEILDQLHNEIGLEPLSSPAAFDALRQVLAHSGSQYVLLHGEREWLDRFVQRGATPRRDQPRETSISPDLLDQARQIVRTLFAVELKIPTRQIRLREPLECYGIDSIMIHQLNRALEQRLGALPRTLLLEHNTLEDVADYLARNHAQQLPAAVVASGDPPSRERIAEIGFGGGASSPIAVPADPPTVREKNAGRQDIAIIGMSGRFPKARDLDEFWSNLRAGIDCVSEIPPERWALDTFFEPGAAVPGKSYTKWGGFLDDVDQFDPLPFQIAPRDADFIDPQERLFLEATWTALENAGHTRQSLARRGAVGVFVGVMYGDYGLLANEEASRGNYVPAASSYWSIANRVSFVLNLHGPSLAIDTACSSSLTAIHLACESLQRGECRTAVAGGVNLSLHPGKYLGLSFGRFASLDGRCRSFGEGGTGYVPGEGVGALVLKPLAEAEADGDFIHGVIRATAINHGGKTSRYTAPNPQAQADLIAEALDRARAAPQTISYLEAHGTGTELGDPLEIRGLTRAFGGDNTTRPYCALGSVKSNIGHLEAASGMAAVAKVLLQMRHGELAPTLHCERINPAIDLAHSPFYLQQDLAEWKRPMLTENGRQIVGLRRAGVSSFGAGGANAHLILDEYVAPAREVRPATRPLLFVLSSRTEEQVRRSVVELRDFLNLQCDSTTFLSDVAFTLQVGREPMSRRLAILAENRGALLDRLNQYLGEEDLGEHLCRAKLSTKTMRSATRDASSQMACSLVERAEWEELARQWVSGLDVDWLELGFGAGWRRTPLPTYPFERKRYWIPQIRSGAPWPGAWTPLAGGSVQTMQHGKIPTRCSATIGCKANAFCRRPATWRSFDRRWNRAGSRTVSPVFGPSSGRLH